MNKSTLIAIVISGVILVGGGIAFAVSRDSMNDEAMDMPANATMPMENGMNESAESSDEEVVEATEVTISDYAYAPQNIRVKAGTTVTWTNQDSVAHDVMPAVESADFEASPLLRQGQSYSFTFNTPGTYEYFCSPHPYMTGTVEVVE